MLNKKSNRCINNLAQLLDYKGELAYTDECYRNLSALLYAQVIQESTALEKLFEEKCNFDAYTDAVAEKICDINTSSEERFSIFKAVRSGYLIGGMA